ncbi:MAG TPA: hypothetical protein VFQ76_09365 [Longimicrobiaceae bacterium]|nr:hypothetical protein [Longimicrobiaceae bacterium]
MFLATAWLTAVKVRWPDATYESTRERWMRSSTGRSFLKTSVAHMHANRVSPQAWVGYVMATASRTMTPLPPDVGLASSQIVGRLRSYQAWRERTPFALPAAALGGEWAEAHNGLVRLQGRLRALDSEWRHAELRGTVDGQLSDALACHIVNKHLPDWENLYQRIALKVGALDAKVREMVGEGVFVWAPIVR